MFVFDSSHDALCLHSHKYWKKTFFLGLNPRMFQMIKSKEETSKDSFVRKKKFILLSFFYFFSSHR